MEKELNAEQKRMTLFLVIESFGVKTPSHVKTLIRIKGKDVEPFLMGKLFFFSFEAILHNLCIRQSDRQKCTLMNLLIARRQKRPLVK